MFEVTKAEDETERSNSPPPSPGANPKPASALRVTVPSELQGVAYIAVLCQKG
jgi:mediator of RNA polymerase II transcription subunit 17